MKGEHLAVDLWGVDDIQCSDVELFTRVGKHIACLLEATLVDTMSTHFEAPNPGCSVIMLLNKSHISFHTDTKEHTVAVDVFCCSTEGLEYKVLPVITEHIHHSYLRKRCISRM